MNDHTLLSMVASISDAGMLMSPCRTKRDILDRS